MKKLSVIEIKYIAFKIAQETMDWDEPIPKFETRYPGILESCLATPFQTFDKRLLYKGLIDKAAVLFYLMIKNHPFENGNKRIAVTTLFTFLMLNKKWLKVLNEDLYEIAVQVAGSKPYLKDQIIELIKAFIKKHIIDA